MERDHDLKLKYKGIGLTNKVLLEENRALLEVRENEARLFRLYAKKEDGLKKKIERDQGEITNLRKELVFKKSKEHSHLFGGTRDKILGFKWRQTP